MDIVLRKIAKNYALPCSFGKNARNQLVDAMTNGLKKETNYAFLKLQAITQLGYSRNGTDACLPDELIKHIKEYVFYDLKKVEMQERKILAIWKHYDECFQKDWLKSGGHHATDCSCYTRCVDQIHECMKYAIKQFVE